MSSAPMYGKWARGSFARGALLAVLALPGLLPPAAVGQEAPGAREMTLPPPAAVVAPRPGTLTGDVVDGTAARPVADASVTLRRVGPDVPARWSWHATTGADGAYRFDDLGRGRYELVVERFGYRSAVLQVALERDEPLHVSVLIEPLPFVLAPLEPTARKARGPSLVGPPAGRPQSGSGARSAAERGRQQRYLSPDVRQVSQADLREANTVAEDDLFRALQRSPGVAVRDDYAADLWTRGAAGSQTAVLFDGIPVLGGFHVLGAFGGFNTDMLGTATFQPGVAGAAEQGAGAGLVLVESRSAWDPDGGGAASLSMLSGRASMDGALSDRVGWALGARRSHLDAVSRLARDLGLRSSTLPYVFGDVTGRVDALLGAATRLEASGFWQADRVSGEVADLARGNEGDWGARVARASLVTVAGPITVRSTAGVSTFDASVSITASDAGDPVHPPTENHYRALVWETRLDGEAPGGSWSVGLRASRERHAYNGPGIDLARLLSPQDVARRGSPDLIPIIASLERAHLLETQAMTRVAAWAQRRQRIAGRFEVDGGIRAETGSPVQGGDVRLAPRLQLSYGPPGSPISLGLAYGRAYQYVQSVARTDVLRSGLRVSELLEQANRDTPALRSDLLTLGGEVWAGRGWLVGSSVWLRWSAGLRLPDPTPGVIDGPRDAVTAAGIARGLEVSVRRLEGPVRGFANYSLSSSRQRVGAREFPASEDRRHVANMGVTADAGPHWTLGATARWESGAPYTRITVVETTCGDATVCPDYPPVLYGAPGGQRAPAYADLDLMAEWRHAFDGWSLSVYGQLRNVLGNANEITYYSSCLCETGDAAGRASLEDRFDRGLPRLPLVGVRARFR